MPDRNHSQLTSLLEQALKEWHHEEIQISLERALPHLIRQAEVTWSHPPTARRRAVNQILLNLLEALAQRDEEAAILLRRRYIDDETGFAVANSLGISESGFYRRRREAIQTLANLAYTQEMEARSGHLAILENRLEASSYSELVGVTGLKRRLHQFLDPQSEIRLVCLSGIGGIGKTALADALAREAIEANRFAELAWVSARQQQLGLSWEIQETDNPVLTPEALLSALDKQLSDVDAPPRPAQDILPVLKARLNRLPHLLIVDNLETAADHQALFPLLRELSQIAWILLTSRVKPYEQPDVHITNLTELSRSDAEALIRGEALRRGIDDLAEAPAEIMVDIYDIAGGNPLALKLIIGQVQVRSLSRVLTDLSEARGKRVEALYEFIYRQGWNLLDDVARFVLLTMPLVATPGTRFEHLAEITDLPNDLLDEALDLLARLSLVQVSGPLDQRRYQIHRLTETFLHKQVTKWE